MHTSTTNRSQDSLLMNAAVATRGTSAPRSEVPCPVDGELLHSWKEIAVYLHRDVRTVQRWEKQEGLPVRRHFHRTAATIFAFKAEIDTWRSSRSHKGEVVRTQEVHVSP
jgi:hypothetical protein